MESNRQYSDQTQTIMKVDDQTYMEFANLESSKDILKLNFSGNSQTLHKIKPENEKPVPQKMYRERKASIQFEAYQ